MSNDQTQVKPLFARASWVLLVMALAPFERAGDCGASPWVAEAARPYARAPARTAALPFFGGLPGAGCSSGTCQATPHPVTPHPAVARIIVPERGATAFGSGTLVDVRDEFGLVVTNWHVVRDSQGVVEVSFPSGFRSRARPLKVDSDWDLAALVIWRPPVEPVPMAAQPPRPGEPLTIHGYGQGQYRIATGRCTAYYAPRLNFPQEMVELNVEARQGDSGGPIFNSRGELAGVLFGAGQGTTIGSFAPRVTSFLATLAPDIGRDKDDEQLAGADRPAPNVRQGVDGWKTSGNRYASSPWSAAEAAAAKNASTQSGDTSKAVTLAAVASPADVAADNMTAGNDVALSDLYQHLKSALAIVGVVAIAAKLVKVAG